MLLEIEFPDTVRPIDEGAGGDTRHIALGFVRLDVICAETGATLGRFDFAAGSPPGVQVIHGLTGSEDGGWGNWSIGPRLCLLLTLDAPPAGDVRLEIRHLLAGDFLASQPSRLRLNKGQAQTTCFAGELTMLAFSGVAPVPACPNNLSHDPDAAPLISILVPDYERPDLVFACLAAIADAAISLPYEVILVENGGGAATRAALDAMALPARRIDLAARRSFSTVNNLALEAARGAFILTLNNDAFITPGLLESLVAALASPDVGAVGPFLLFPDGTPQEAGAGLDPGGYSGTAILNGFGWALPPLGTVQYISAACLMLRRADMLDIGGFDPAFAPAYGEDVDLCLRLRAMGKSTRLLRDRFVYHIGRASVAALGGDQLRDAAAMRNRDVLRARHGRFLATGCDRDLAPTVLLDPIVLARQIGGFAGESVHAVLPGVELAGAELAADRHVLAMAAALGTRGPVLLASEAPGAALDLHWLAREAGVSADRLAPCGLAALDARAVEVAVVASRDFPDVAPAHGRIRVLFCPHPRALDEAGEEEARRRIGGLLNFDAVVTASEAARAACLDILRRLGAPEIAIRVIPTAADPPGAVPSPGRCNLVLSLARLGAGPVGSNHVAVIHAFRALQAAEPDAGWRLVIAGELAPDAGGAAQSLRDAARSASIDVLASPPRHTRQHLLARARIVVFPASRDRDGVVGADPSDIATAAWAGAIPLPVAIAPEAGGWRDAGELGQALLAAARSPAPDVVPAEDWRPMAQSSAWSALIEQLGQRAPPARSAPGVAVPAVVVAGMHRSGTSALARLLGAAGLDLPNRLMLAGPDNPEGFWEPVGVSDLNDAILAARGSAWDDPFGGLLALDAGDDEACFLPGMRRQLAANYSPRHPPVMKDPRISLLAPLWSRALREAGYEPIFVLMLRDPREVAASLNARNGLPFSRGLLLWASTMLAAERTTRGERRLVIGYDDLLADAPGALDRLRRLVPGLLRESDEISGAPARLLDGALRHHVAAPDWAYPHYAPIEAFHGYLCDVARGAPFRDGASEALEHWLRGLRDIVGATRG